MNIIFVIKIKTEHAEFGWVHDFTAQGKAIQPYIENGTVYDPHLWHIPYEEMYVYTEPEGQYIGQLPAGANFQVCQLWGKWAQILPVDGLYGYVCLVSDYGEGLIYVSETKTNGNVPVSLPTPLRQRAEGPKMIAPAPPQDKQPFALENQSTSEKPSTAAAPTTEAPVLALKDGKATSTTRLGQSTMANAWAVVQPQVPPMSSQEESSNVVDSSQQPSTMPSSLPVNSSIVPTSASENISKSSHNQQISTKQGLHNQQSTYVPEFQLQMDIWSTEWVSVCHAAPFAQRSFWYHKWSGVRTQYMNTLVHQVWRVCVIMQDCPLYPAPVFIGLNAGVLPAGSLVIVQGLTDEAARVIVDPKCTNMGRNQHYIQLFDYHSNTHTVYAFFKKHFYSIAQ